MSIKLDLIDDKLAVTVIQSERFAFDKDRLKKIPTCRPKFVDGQFQYWQINRAEICSLLERFHESEVIATKAGQSVIDTYKQAKALPSDLESVAENIDFALVPQVFQEDYIRLSREKRQLLLAMDPGCIAGDAVISVNRNGLTRKFTFEDLYYKFNQLKGKKGLRPWRNDAPSYVKCLVKQDGIEFFALRKIKNVAYSGKKLCIRLHLKSGKSITLTPDHRVAQPDGVWTQACQLSIGDCVLTNGQPFCKTCGTTERISKGKKFPGHCRKCIANTLRDQWVGHRGKGTDKDGYVVLYDNKYKDHPRARHKKRGAVEIYEHLLVMEKQIGRPVRRDEQVHHKNEHHAEHKRFLHLDGGKAGRGGEIILKPRLDYVERVEHLTKPIDVYDLEVDDPAHNFVADRVVVHNCGKSYSSLERAELLGFKKLLICFPPLLAQNWEEEVEQALGEDCLLYDGSPTKRKKLREEAVGQARVVLCPYTKVQELVEFKFDSMILDEAHTVSRPKTQGFKALDQIIYKHNPDCIRQVLTGTPAELDLNDLWGVVYLVSREIAGTYWAWKDRYNEVLRSIQKTVNGRIINIPIKTRYRDLDHMQKRIAPIFVRVRRHNITKFKETTKIIQVPLTERQRDIYEQIKAGILVELAQDKFLNAQHALTQILGLRQICEGSFNVNKEWDDSGKLDYICKRLDERKGKKTVILSAFKEIGYRIQALYPDRTVLYNGDMTKTMKNLAVVSFQGTTKEKVLRKFERWRKLNPKWRFGPEEADIIHVTLDHKQGLGVNLDKADLAIFPSWHWNPFVNAQGRDRLHRLTQQADEVVTEYLTATQTIESELLRRIFERYARVSDALDGKESVSSNEVKELITTLTKS